MYCIPVCINYGVTIIDKLWDGFVSPCLFLDMWVHYHAHTLQLVVIVYTYIDMIYCMWSGNEVNCSGTVAQIVSCHCYIALGITSTCKLYVNSYTSVVNPLRTDIRTYKHNLGLRRHKRPLRPDNTFGNYLSWLCTSEKDPFACSSLDVNTEVYVSACSIVFHSNPKNMQQPQQSESLTVK